MSVELIEAIDERLYPLGFRQSLSGELLRDCECGAIWLRRTWNTNRAVAFIYLPEGETDPGDYAQTIKWKVLRRVRCIPVLWTLGLQVVLYGDGILDKARYVLAHVDKFDNQLVVLQSIFLVDSATGEYTTGSTWGQVFSGKYQDAISAAIGELYDYHDRG